MNRRRFLQSIMTVGVGLVIFPHAAKAAWQTDTGLQGVAIRPTNLDFGPLENRCVTDAIIVHHVGNTNADVSAATMHEWHKANGWSGIGYHFVIRKDGPIEAGRPMDTVGAHCKGENTHTIGINIVGNFETAWPEDAQLASAVKLIPAICRNYGFAPSASTIFGHRDFNATLCPGENLYGLLPNLIERCNKNYIGG